MACTSFHALVPEEVQESWLRSFGFTGTFTHLHKCFPTPRCTPDVGLQQPARRHKCGQRRGCHWRLRHRLQV